jgi:hypothetical protein
MTRDALLLELEAARESLRQEREARQTQEAALRAELDRLLAENAELRHRIEVFSRRMFGRSSEKLAPGQLLLAFEAARAEEAQAICRFR